MDASGLPADDRTDGPERVLLIDEANATPSRCKSALGRSCKSAGELGANAAAGMKRDMVYRALRTRLLRQCTKCQGRDQITDVIGLADKFDTVLRTRKARATNMVAAGEAGLSGLSVEALMRDFASQEARYDDRVDQQTGGSLAKIQNEKRGLGYQTVDRINSVPRARKPSFVDAGLKVAAGAVDSFSSYKKWTT
jgi:hypothetical protein